MGAKIDLTGRRFGRLQVVSPSTYRKPKNRAVWLCLCDCGKQSVVTAGDLMYGNTKSCGCLMREISRANGMSNRRHGFTHTRTYRIWGGMKKRCLNPSEPNYHRYGGRGITLCDRWHSFDAFLEDMGECPSGCSIERIDNDGPYSRENCRWATILEQARNKSNNRKFTLWGETLTLTEWAHRFGLKRPTVGRRLKRGWSIEDALLRPVVVSRAKSTKYQVDAAMAAEIGKNRERA